MKKDELLYLRKQLDKSDEQLCKALTKRFNLVKQIGEVKKNMQLDVCDKQREDVVYQHIASLFNSEEQSQAAKNIYNTIIEESKKMQS